MALGLTPQQEIVEVKIDSTVSGSPKREIDAVLATKPAHRIVSMSVTSTQEFGTAALALLVIEYLKDCA